jgi:2-polyprenyl-3-methyl-5-hydroxy-6-metoxy-1,4-benzoquinol methylase
MNMSTRVSRKHKYLAFGVEPNRNRYRLRLARYAALVETLSEIATTHRARDGAPLRVLDAGAGRGRTVRYLDQLGDLSAFELHAIDLDTSRIEDPYHRERWKSIKSVDLSKGIPFSDSSFDLVICEQVLEHIEDIDGVLQELVRVLRAGGVLIVGTPTFPQGLASVRRHVVPALDRVFGRVRGHCQVFTASRLVRWINGHAELTVKECRGFRIVSGGPLSPLENMEWWYRFNRQLGERVPALCIECQVIATKSQEVPRPGA